MIGDLPAAHSMDTCWFAVDDEGHVAVLETGQSGARPLAWTGEPYGGQAIFDAVRSAGFPVGVPDALACEPSGRLWWRGEDLSLPGAPFLDEHHDLLVRLAHPRVASLIPGAAALPVEGGAPFAVVSCSVPGTLISALLRRGLIECAWSWCALPPNLFGLYDYRNDDSGASMPYARAGAPVRPLRIVDLPTQMQQMAMRLPVRFAQTPLLQPAGLLPCLSRELQWVDIDGTWHEFDG